MKIKQSKKEVHQLKVKAHYGQKEININVVEAKLLQTSLELAQNDCLELNNRVKELKIILETVE